MVVDQLNVENIGPFKPEHDAPISPYRQRPETPPLTFKGMESISGKFHSLRRAGIVENCENSFHRIQQIRSYPTPVATFIESFQAPMLEALNHQDAP
jgi:hypothetical protein